MHLYFLAVWCNWCIFISRFVWYKWCLFFLFIFGSGVIDAFFSFLFVWCNWCIFIFWLVWCNWCIFILSLSLSLSHTRAHTLWQGDGDYSRQESLRALCFRLSVLAFFPFPVQICVPTWTAFLPRMSDVSLLSGTSGLSFDSSFLSPLSIFCHVTFLLLNHIFLETVVQYFFVKSSAFLCGSCWAATGWKVVCAACCRTAVVSARMHVFFFCVCVQSGLNHSQWSTILAQYLYNKDNIGGTNSLKFSFDVCVCTFCSVFVYGSFSLVWLACGLFL